MSTAMEGSHTPIDPTPSSTASGTDRWSVYTDMAPSVAAGWRLETVIPPSRLGGANGTTIGPDGRLYVAQLFFSQVTAIDVDTGEHELFSPLGSGIRGPDDGIFAADGTFYATEWANGRVTARDADGSYRVVADGLQGPNGVTMDHAGRRLFVNEFRQGGRLMELDPTGVASPDVLLDDLAGGNAMAMGPDGRLWFPQVMANEVWWYDLDTGEHARGVADVACPTAVKFDSHGRVVIAESAVGRITAVDIATGERTTLAEVPLCIDNFSFGVGDRLFVSHADDGRVTEETAGGSRMLSAPGLIGPLGLAVAADGIALFADGVGAGRVRDGVAERSVRLPIDLPTLALGVAELDGDMVVLGANGEILRFAPDGGQPSTIATGLDGSTSVRVDGKRLVVTERSAGRVVAVDAGGIVTPVVDGLPSAASVEIVDGEYVVTAGSSVVIVETSGGRRTIDGFADAQGVAAAGDVVIVADADRHELVAVSLSDGRRQVVVSGAPIGLPVDGAVPNSFAPLAADGAGGVLVGCNGDGSIRRLRRT